MKYLHLQVDFRICYETETETIYEMTYNKEKYSLRVLHDGKFHNKIYECDKEIPEELTFFVDTIINRETYKQVGTK